MKKSNSPLSLFLVFFALCSCKEEMTPSEANNEKKSKSSPPIPADPLFSYSWHLKNDGTTKAFSSTSGVAGESLKAFAANNLGYTGKGIRIVVSDTGAEIAHEDLRDNMLDGEHKDYSLEPPYLGDPTPGGDKEGHGTSVSGIIAAAANTLGSRGVAYEAKLAGFNYLTYQSSASKIDQASGDFDIFNYSYGISQCVFSDSSTNYINQLKYGITNLRKKKGAIYVKSAGNDYTGSTKECFPNTKNPRSYFGNANYNNINNSPYLILVAALNAKGISSSYSSPGSAIWVSAPAGEYGITHPAIITTDRMGCSKGYAHSKVRQNSKVTRNNFENGTHSLNPDCNYTAMFNGTSSAAPMVSGAVAVILQANPALTWRDVKYILAKTARKVDPDVGVSEHPIKAYNLPEYTYTQDWIKNKADFNFHNWYGFGAVDLEEAVKLAKNYTPPWNTSDSFQESTWIKTVDLNLTIPDESATGVTHTLSVSKELTIEAVQIKVEVEHTYIGDLGIELTSPGGTKSILMHINSNVQGENMNNILASNAFYMENSQGNWTIKVLDGGTQDIGTLKSWKIKIFGH